MQRRKREWFQALFCVYFILYGVLSLANMGRYGGTVINSFPVVFRYLYAMWLTVSAAGVLVQMFRTRSATAVLRERAGLLMLSGLGAIYGCWSLITLPPRGAGFTLFWLTVAVACFLNAWEISLIRGASGSNRLGRAYLGWLARAHHRNRPLDQGEAGSQEDER